MPWKSWNMGWGEDYKLARGLTMTVYKGMSRGDKFSFTVFGLRSKKQYETMEEAKQAAEKNAKIILSNALKELIGE